MYNTYIEEQKETISPKFKIVISDNFYESQLTFASKRQLEHLQNFDENEKERSNSFNGYLLMPTNEREEFIILLNPLTFDEQNTFIGTFHHEITHMFDYSKYMNDCGIISEEKMFDTEYYHCMYYWSEYHARKLGYTYLRKYVQIIFNLKQEEIVEHIKNTEIPTQMIHLNECTDKYVDNKRADIFIYELVLHYGRMIVWEDYGFKVIEEDIFPKQKLINLLGNASIELYNLLSNMNDYHNAKLKFKDLKNLIVQIDKNHSINNLYRFAMYNLSKQMSEILSSK